MKDKYKTKGHLIKELDAMRRRVEELEQMGDENLWPEKALQETEKRYQALIETNLYGIQEIDIYGIITFMNSVQYKILGYTMGELKGKQIWDLLATDSDREELTDYLTRVAEGEYAPFPWIGKFIRKNGSIIQLQVDWNYRHDTNGRVTGFISVISDILATSTGEESEDHPEEKSETEPAPSESLDSEEAREAGPKDLNMVSQLIDTSDEMDSKLDGIQQMLEYLHKEFQSKLKEDSHKNRIIDNLANILLKSKSGGPALNINGAQPKDAPPETVPPIHPPIVEGPDYTSLVSKMDSLFELFESKVKTDEHKNKIIDKLHLDLQDYKNDFLKKYLESIIMDVIQIIDNIRKLAMHYHSREVADIDPIKLIRLLESIPSDLEDLFYRHGVKPFMCEGNDFDPSRQRVLKTLITEDISQDKTVAESLRPGYEWDGKVIRPEMVSAYIMQTKPQTGNKGVIE